MSRAALGLLFLATMLAGCGALDPYPTVPRAIQPGQPAGARVAICYNTMKSTLAQVQTEAQQECAANTMAEPVDTDWYMHNCPLLLPARATFVCRAAPK
jgi:hypothetical protein